ncbi:DnaJ domain-containing protein [Spiroplasma endosymbiont of Aspidapion aeneum]|uniref:DnaJ domain-containing protein n=1 Tax=Spiroplasma endosymbiont of Aspidapion aeneum TaxID=3066276 RepID=UPI00313E9F89
MDVRTVRGRKYYSLIIWLWITLSVYSYLFIAGISRNYNDNDGKIIITILFVLYLLYTCVGIAGCCIYISRIKMRIKLLVNNGQDLKPFNLVEIIIWIFLFFIIALWMLMVNSNIELEKSMKENGTFDDHMRNSQAQSQNINNFFNQFRQNFQGQNQDPVNKPINNYELAKAYGVLGLNEKASEDEIKRAYKALIMKWHPDKNDSKNAAIKTSEINAAYDLIRKNRGF